MTDWIVGETNRWHQDSYAIQTAFFRTGVFAYLDINHVTTQGGKNIVSWKYTFRDLGMDHLLHKRFSIDSNTITDMDTEETHTVDNKDTLRTAVFKDHAKQYTERLYQQIGVDIFT